MGICVVTRQRLGVIVRTPNRPLPHTARLNFLLGASDNDLSSFELARLSEVANLRTDLHLILDKLIDEMAQAAVAGWFKQTDRETLKGALETIENPEKHADEIVAWAKARIRDGQRSDAPPSFRKNVPCRPAPPSCQAAGARRRSCAGSLRSRRSRERRIAASSPLLPARSDRRAWNRASP